MKELSCLDTTETPVAIKDDRFDYTEWRRNFFDKMTDEEYHNAAVEYAKTHPFKGKAKII